MDRALEVRPAVEVLNHYGSDALVAQVASTSHGNTKKNKKDWQVGRLIKTLIKKEHMSPFEHAGITYFIECPIYVARHLVRHRTAKIVEKSLRYTKPLESGAEYDESVRLEVTRRDLPLSTITQLVYTQDLRNLMHFFKLRLAEDAEDKTREVALEMYAYFKELFPLAAKWWEEKG